MCAPLIEASSIPGTVRTSTGKWCFPGFHENPLTPGQCTHDSRVDCPGGYSCGMGTRCDGNGGCLGGSPSGPICDPADPRRCEDSSFSCTSRGTCIASYNRECRRGRICDRQAACGMTACVIVGPTRTAQVPRATVGIGAGQTQPQTGRDQLMAKCSQLAGSLAPYRQGMGEAWYAEQLGKSSCNADGTPR